METGDARQSGFDPAAFRDAIEFAMAMGLPGAVGERVTFVWKPVKTYTNEDTRNAPYDFTEAPATNVTATDVPASLTVPAAVEFRGSKTNSGDTVIGSFDAATAEITVLDTAYAQLIDDTLGLPDMVTIDGSIYDIDYWHPPVGLFAVSVYTCIASARDEA
jgi:hypothetical protein